MVHVGRCEPVAPAAVGLAAFVVGHVSAERGLVLDVDAQVLPQRVQVVVDEVLVSDDEEVGVDLAQLPTELEVLLEVAPSRIGDAVPGQHPVEFLHGHGSGRALLRLQGRHDGALTEWWSARRPTMLGRRWGRLPGRTTTGLPRPGERTG